LLCAWVAAASFSTELISNGRTHTGTGSLAASPWLFPGGLPGKPITAARLGSRLRALGVGAQTGRRAALLDLAGQLPAAVLADLVGLAPAIAVKWMRQAGGDWSSCAAEAGMPSHLLAAAVALGSCRLRRRVANHTAAAAQ
jgi:hypothetical protein